MNDCASHRVLELDAECEGGPVLKRLRVANCSAFRSASSSARPIVVCPTASSSTKDKCVENGCFLCPWSECVKQPAKVPTPFTSVQLRVV